METRQYYHFRRVYAAFAERVKSRFNHAQVVRQIAR